MDSRAGGQAHQGGSEPGALDGMDLDIYGFWAECRRDQPVVEVDGATMGRPTWMVTRYDDVEAVLRDPDRFSSRINNETMGPVMGALILGMDGDEHRRYRSLVAQAFRPSALARWDEELIAPTITALLDADRAARACRSGRGRDEPVPGAGDRRRARGAGRGLRAIPEVGARDLAGAAGLRLEHARVAARCASTSSPSSQRGGRIQRDDLVSRTSSPPRSTVSAFRTSTSTASYGLLLPAGAETTFRVMGSTLFALLTHPEVMDRALADASMIDRVIEEVLRWETSVTMVNRESLSRSRSPESQVPKGASLVCCTGSANHDESRYEDPERFDPDRDAKPHIAFGTGRHQCLGMHLARLELRVGVSAVLDRLPNLRLDPDAQPPRSRGSPSGRRPSLPVLFDPT